MTKKKTVSVKNNAEYSKGYNTGMSRGYRAGMDDAIKVIDSILSNNGIHMATKEFYIELNTLIEEGEISPLTSAMSTRPNYENN